MSSVQYEEIKKSNAHAFRKADILDQKENMRRKFLAKCRFKAIVRRVMANIYWLMEMDEEEVYDGDNVKRRVVQAIRTKKRKGLLCLKDKALLNKPTKDRTEEEKKYIYRKIGGLKCFKRYPNHVKRKLAAATYFVYYGPNRVIVKQNQEAHALYFVVTGEVVVSVLVFDEMLKQYNYVNVFVMAPGDMFGEVSLLHNINRTATCTTVGHCEFLALMKKDFKNILQASLMQQWDEVKRAMSSFNYFDSLDEVARREGCIIAKMKSYEPNETILGDGAGLANFVYFVLSGRCQMIETLKIGVSYKKGAKRYSLYEPFIQKNESETDLTSKYFSGSFTKPEPTIGNTSEDVNILKKESASPEEGSFLTQVAVENSSEKIAVSKNISNIENEVMPGILKKESVYDVKNNETLETKCSKRVSTVNPRIKNYELNKTKDSINSNEDAKRTHDSRRQSLVSKQSVLSKATTDSNSSKFFKYSEPEPPESARISTDARFWAKDAASINYNTYFMQVCKFLPGSTFGFGENMYDRRIVALTKVDCMLLPKMWLLQRNTANIWSRIQHYLERKIPTKKELFHIFINQRRWEEAREGIVKNIVKRTNNVNYTTVHDVPYSIRMEELSGV